MNCDTLIKGGRVINGTGSPWRQADIAVTGDKIVAITPPGAISGENARDVVDATGKIVAPGFIDIQSHSLLSLFTDGRSLSKITQGVTTEILGELWTPAPLGGRRDLSRITEGLTDEQKHIASTWKRFADWIDFYPKVGVSVNVGSFVGGATVREWACGWDANNPTNEQLEQMRRVTHEAMDDGAFGIAPALIYPPNSFSSDHELTEMARVVAQKGGIYIVHLRSEGDGFLEALDSAATLSRTANCPVEVYHLKASGARNHPKMARAIARIHELRADGVDITADMYPYVASGTGLSVLIPDWASEGGKLYENLRDSETRKRIHAQMMAPSAATGDFSGDSATRGDHVMPLGFQKTENKGYIGRRLSAIADERGQDWANCAIDLLLSEGQRIATVFFSMSEDNLKLQLQQDWVKISTDAPGIDPATQKTPVHPRAYGTYPRVLGHYTRDLGVITLEDAVRKMSGAVADRISLVKRGYLFPDFYADITVFDPEAIIDNATFADPNHLSVGIEQVWVNGARVLKNGEPTGAKPGRTVRPNT